jgi:iron(III) transport system substrate-binding protein
VPLDVSQGQAAIGVSIDFYGRYQAQAVMKDDETPDTSRVGYVDPEGQVFIDADPITLLRGGPDPQMAQRFIRFVLSDEGQALWQFPARGADAPASVADDPSTWGPRRFELRRMPVRRDFIDAYQDRFIDRVDPFELASKTENRGWRSSLSRMMATFAIETHDELKKAWAVLNEARADEGFPDETLAEMERLFYAMPVHEFPDGTELEFSEEHYRAIREAWRDPGEERRALLRYRAFFKDNYERVVELGRNPGDALADRAP